MISSAQNLVRPTLYPSPLPHAALPLADWADCYRVCVATHPDLSAMAFARLALGRFPPWARLLLGLRDALVRPFGVQTTDDLAAKGAESIGFFPIVSATERQVVVGLDDTHLDFRLVVDVVDQGPAGTTVSVTTLVHRKILLGRLYIAVITPFHRLIVRAALSAAARRLAAAAA